MSGERPAASSRAIHSRRSSASRFVAKLPPYLVAVSRPPTRYSTLYRGLPLLVTRFLGVVIQALAIRHSPSRATRAAGA